MRLAREIHPYHSDDWLSKYQAEEYLFLELDRRIYLTKRLLRDMGCEVSSTGHIRKLSLEHFVEREKYYREHL